ncbi:uncharacterized protein C2845_PM03G30970 [Panicum miliaceum]|uniref:Uncharacterized protein n=1 Tax=Panicum miliaceum TaxID=4540 RepID=A0A3L6TF29_PANMI|nr:uncharacterized protein C2845_PM03G30970 [Panicum miliaceum]
MEIVLTEGELGEKVMATVNQFGATTLVIGLHDKSFLYRAPSPYTRDDRAVSDPAVVGRAVERRSGEIRIYREDHFRQGILTKEASCLRCVTVSDKDDRTIVYKGQLKPCQLKRDDQGKKENSGVLKGDIIVVSYIQGLHILEREQLLL